MAEGPTELYESGFRYILEGDYGEAYDTLGEVIAEYPDTPYARMAAERRTRLERLNLPSIRRKHIDQSGRVESVVFSTLYSTWLGIGTARLLDSEDGDKAIAAGMMLGAPIGMLTSLALTRDARLTDGQAALVNFSGYWGTWQGYGWSSLLDGNDDEKTLIAGAMAGGLLGLATTSSLTRHFDLTTGDAALINYGALWGTWLSVCGGGAAEVDDDDAMLALTLIGGNLGAAAMAVAAPRTDMSLGRASLINLGGLVGTLTATGVLIVVEADNAQAVFGILMLGGITGLGVGLNKTKRFDQNPPTRQAVSWRATPGTSSQSGWPHSCTLGSAGDTGELRTELLSLRF